MLITLGRYNVQYISGSTREIQNNSQYLKENWLLCNFFSIVFVFLFLGIEFIVVWQINITKFDLYVNISYYFKQSPISGEMFNKNSFFLWNLGFKKCCEEHAYICLLRLVRYMRSTGTFLWSCNISVPLGGAFMSFQHMNF